MVRVSYVSVVSSLIYAKMYTRPGIYHVVSMIANIFTILVKKHIGKVDFTVF